MAPPPSPSPGLRPTLWRVLAASAVLAAVGVLAARWWREEPGPPPDPPPDPFPLTPLSASPYLNTGPDARYVGSGTCRSCHLDRHESFRGTGMGRSMAEADPAREPPDAAYDHAASKRRYQVVRRDGRMWHRELLTGGAAEVLLSEFPVKYVVGSGRHSRTYLCEADGFLVESPATWYSARKAWGMSPGYDAPDQPGFERATGEGCLVCHAGRAEAVGGTLHRMNVIEPAIACERCHGPGSLHVDRHRGRDGPVPTGRADADLTIVNPARLPRELAESVCQQCHLRPAAVVVARGRKPTDFRPGLPISDVLHAYQPDAAGGSMTVVGHVEQLHLSRCYQASDSLTCLTCHSPPTTTRRARPATGRRRVRWTRPGGRRRARPTTAPAATCRGRRPRSRTSRSRTTASACTASRRPPRPAPANCSRSRTCRGSRRRTGGGRWGSATWRRPTGSATPRGRRCTGRGRRS